jgi:hypothetical protein
MHLHPTIHGVVLRDVIEYGNAGLAADAFFEVPRRDSWVKSGRFGRLEACGNVDNTRGIAHNSTGSTSNKDSVNQFELEGWRPGSLLN